MINQIIRSQMTRAVAIPIVALICFLVFIVVYQLGGGPSPELLVELAKRYYLEHGYWVVFCGALGEAVLLINWYLPGSLVVALGMVFSRQGIMDPIVVVGISIVGFGIGMVVNYGLGRYGWYRVCLRLGLQSTIEKAKNRLLRHGLPLIFITYIHPNSGAIVATACGILGLPFNRFLIYSILALFLWNSFWGVVIYTTGDAVIKLMDLKIIIPVVALWALLAVIRSVHQRRNKGVPNGTC